MRTACVLPVMFLCALALPAADPITQKPEVAPSVLRDTVAPTEQPKPPSAEWAKRFAAAPATGWIWGENIRKDYCLSKTFDAKGVKEARVRLTCDNTFVLFVNGKQVAASTEWQQAVEVDITKNLVAGDNTLEAEVTNEGATGGFVLQLVTDKAEVSVMTDATWVATAKRGAKDGVKARQVAKYGDQPRSNAGATHESSRRLAHNALCARAFASHPSARAFSQVRAPAPRHSVIS